MHVSEDAYSYEMADLPEGWITAKLSDIYLFEGGGTPDKSYPTYWNGGIPWASVKDIKDKFIYNTIDQITKEGLENSSSRLSQDGEVIIVTRISPGKSTIAKREIAINQDLKIVNSNGNIPSLFTYYLFNFLQRHIVERSSGTTVPGIRLNELENIQISLPPFREQNRIIEKIEELFSELDKGIEYLKTAQEQLKVYRQSVLKYAFEGKLTEQWREAHIDQIETADQLLERIQQERENLYLQQLNEWEEAIKAWEEDGKDDKKPNKPRQPENLTSFTEEELIEMPSLPEGWMWLKLGNLNVDVFDGPFGSNLKTSDYIDRGIRVIRLENIDVLRFNDEKKVYVSQEKYEVLKRHTVVSGDLIFASFIAEEIRVAIVPQYVEMAINKADCFCIRSQGNIIKNHYLSKFLSTRNAYHQLKSQVHGATRPRINTTQLKNCVIPVTSSFEQEKVNAEIDERFSEVEQLENDIEKNLKRLELLRQSILKRAFSGTLVLQDPNDEPASTLLERIRAERQAAPPKPKREPNTSRKKLRKNEVVDLVSVLESASNWLSAQDAFRECGVSDGAETEAIEKLYLELRDLEKEDHIEVQRRGNEDWLRICPTARS